MTQKELKQKARDIFNNIIYLFWDEVNTDVSKLDLTDEQEEVIFDEIEKLLKRY